MTCRAATHQVREVATVPNASVLRATRVRTAELQPVIVQRTWLRTLMKDARRGLQTLDETTERRLLDMIELSRRGSNP